MRILLVNPPNSGRSIPEEAYGIENIKMIFRGEPLALETIAGNLSGHEVRIADLKAEPDGLWHIFDRFRPDVVGMTAVTCEANNVLKMAREMKLRANPIVVVGGHHATCDAEFFNRTSIDYIVIGLGKRSFKELVDGLAAGKSTAGIAGVAKTHAGGPLFYVSRPYTADDLVDNRPPRYDLVKAHREKYVMSGVGGKTGFVASAFGCTNRCIFCTIPGMTGGKYLTHGIDAILRDIQMLEDVQMIRFVDANSFGDHDKAVRLGQEILKAGVKKNFIADVCADTVVRYPRLFELWKEAGLAAAVVGFEEIDPQRLRDFKKSSSLDDNIAAVEILKRLGIRIIGDFIISPDYTHDAFEKLEHFVEKHAIDLPIPSILTPIPGTPLYHKLKHRITCTDLDYYTFTNAVIPTRLEEKEFYETYAGLLSRFLKNVDRNRAH